MGFLSRFEGKMEDTLEGAADRMMNAPISPVQIAKKAEKQMRREKMVGAGKQYAPTLYTVLVNPDDDHRLFGYYPTLAGETETYLAAKAAHEGLVMDGQPLVRFIVDDGLKHGKFDIIAEAVAAPIIAQLRSEEMQRYGIGAPSSNPPYGGTPTPYGAPVQSHNFGAAPSQPFGNRQPVATPAPTGDYDNNAYDPYLAPQQAEPYHNQPVPQPYQDLDAGFDDYTDFDSEQKPPLPYVPENELDYSIDYGEYTFDSQNFNDYRENGRSQGVPVAGAGAAAVAAGAGVAAAGYAAAPTAEPAYAPAPQQQGQQGVVAADTVVFAAGAGGVNAVPNQAAVRARLIDTTNSRTYTLASGRLLMGRESKNDIVVNDINASRTHAELRFEPQGVWTVTDLGSTNGTLVNGVEVATQPLYEGDQITIGTTNYAFSLA